jgi:hypothetical protein
MTSDKIRKWQERIDEQPLAVAMEVPVGVAVQQVCATLEVALQLSLIREVLEELVDQQRSSPDDSSARPQRP